MFCIDYFKKRTIELRAKEVKTAQEKEEYSAIVQGLRYILNAQEETNKQAARQSPRIFSENFDDYLHGFLENLPKRGEQK